VDETNPPPHSYKAQRTYERDANAARQKMLRNGTSKIPPICGYTYKTRKARVGGKQIPSYIAVCARTAGTNTNHHGRGFCDYHDWQANAEADKRNNPTQTRAALKVAAERAQFFGKQVAIDPHTALLDEIARTASVVAWLNDQMQQLRNKGMSDTDIIQQRTLQNGFRPSVWMELYQTERDHLVKTCVAAIKAGVAERKVQIAERQGQLIASMMFAFIHDIELGLNPDQIIAAPGLIRKHLMALPMAAPEASIDPSGILKSTHKYGKDIIDVPSRPA
jgi:hypothetical protein